MTLAPSIQFGSYSIDHQLEMDILAWYSQLQLRIVTVMPACVRTRKLASVAGWAKMGIIYEFASVELRGIVWGRERSQSSQMAKRRKQLVRPRLPYCRAPDLARDGLRH